MTRPDDARLAQHIEPPEPDAQPCRYCRRVLAGLAIVWALCIAAAWGAVRGAL